MAVNKVFSPHPVMPVSGPIVARLEANNLIGKLGYRLVAATQVEEGFHQSGQFIAGPTLDISPDPTDVAVPDNTTFFDLYARLEQVLRGYLQWDSFDPNYDVLSFVENAIRQVEVEYAERYSGVDYPTGLSDAFAVLYANLNKRRSLYRTRKVPGGLSCTTTITQPDVLAPYFGAAPRKFLTLWDYKRVHPSDTDWLYWYTGDVDPSTIVVTLTYREADGTVVTGTVPLDFTDTNTCQDMSFTSKILAIPLRLLLAGVSAFAVSACVKFQGQEPATTNVTLPLGNGTFESGTLSDSGVSAVNASISTFNPYQGLRSGAVAGQSSSNKIDITINVTAGNSYVVSVWAAIGASGGPSPDYGAALEVVGQGTDIYSSGGSTSAFPYTQLSVSFTAVATGAQVIRLRPEGSAFFSGELYFDNLTVVETGLGPLVDVSEEKCYILDQTCYPQRLTMRFVNRLGMTETCHLTGELRFEQKAEASEYRTDLASLRPGTTVNAERRVFNVSETYQYTVSTGQIAEYEALNFADVLASPQVEVLVDTGSGLEFVPVRITTESARIFNTRLQKEPLAIQFEAEEKILPSANGGGNGALGFYNPSAGSGFTCASLLNCTVFTQLQADVAQLQALATPYTQSVTAQTSVVVAQATHGRTQPATLQARTATGQLVEFDATVDPTTKDVTFTFSPAFTGLILIA